MRREQIQGGVRSTGWVNQNVSGRPFSLIAAVPIRAGSAKVAPETLSHPSPRKTCSENCHPSRFLSEGPRLMHESCAHSFPEALQEKRTAAHSKAQSLRIVSPSSSPTLSAEPKCLRKLCHSHPREACKTLAAMQSASH